MNHIPNTRKSTQSFVNVLQKAKEWFATLSKTDQQNLTEDLEHGAGHLATARQLNAYIAKYGEAMYLFLGYLDGATQFA